VHGDIAWTAPVLRVDAALAEGAQPLQARQQLTLV
jgi:hypothetical protein